MASKKSKDKILQQAVDDIAKAFPNPFAEGNHGMFETIQLHLHEKYGIELQRVAVSKEHQKILMVCA